MSYLVDTDESNLNLNLSIGYNSANQEMTDYRCDQCGKYFSAARSLVLHKKIHVGIKPYVCPHEGCGKAFYVRAQLTRHSYTHSTVRTEKCPYKNCTSPIKLFKTKADVRQHVKNWHTLEKSEQRELRLMKKLEKWKSFTDSYKQIRERNRELEEENKRLKSELELFKTASQSSLSSKPTLLESPSETKPRRPVPAYTQFLQEQYQRMKDMGEKMTFTECSKQISKMWRDLPEEEKKPYVERFRREMEDFNSNRFVVKQPALPDASTSQNVAGFQAGVTSGELLICRKCGSNDIFHSFPSNPLYTTSFTNRDLPEASLPSLHMITDSM